MRRPRLTGALAASSATPPLQDLAPPSPSRASRAGWWPTQPLVRRDWRASAALGVLAALACALAARLPYFAGSDFPLNDGGMFVAMARDLLAAHFQLPYTTSYNFESVAFAYPPVAFYLVAAISAVTGLDAITLARYLPLLANLGTVAAVALLARSIVDPRAALLGPIVFALIPRSYEWMIMGGGLTRSFGFMFAVACLVVARQLFRGVTAWRFIGCAVLAALALATHLELGLFVCYSLGLMALCYGRGLRAVLLSVAVGIVALGLTAPWWLTVIGRHGLGPFMAASHTGEWTTPLQQLQSLEDFITPPKLLLSMPGTLAVFGVLACLMRGQPFLPVWLPLVFLLNPRSAPTEGALPLALLAAVGLSQVIGPGLAVAVERARSASRPFSRLRAAWLRVWDTHRRAPVIAGLGVAVALLGIYLSWPSMHPNRHALDVLSPSDREAMQWVSQQTDATAQFLVLTRGWTWEDDHVSEWFPVLADRHSVLTVQATEWLPDNLFIRTHCLYDQVRQLGSLQWGVDRLDQWARDRGVVFSDIYVSPSIDGSLDWRPLIQSARQSPDYTVRYDSADDVVVLQRRQPIQPRWDTSGQLLVADDCTSLSEQPVETQRGWEATYGPLAGRAWVDAHNEELGETSTPLDGLRQLVLGRTTRLGS